MESEMRSNEHFQFFLCFRVAIQPKWPLTVFRWTCLADKLRLCWVTMVQVRSLALNWKKDTVFAEVQPGTVKFVLWRHWMYTTQVHPVRSKNQLHCTRLCISTVRSGAEERTFWGARLDVLIFRLRSYCVLISYTTHFNGPKICKNTDVPWSGWNVLVISG